MIEQIDSWPKAITAIAMVIGFCFFIWSITR